ncbi:MAG: IS200/IS605 family element transposase accessory protein TnpB, partial [Longispora sp.]|nr:IS200/IS605 family element transposase accessory protein TnpB [Longispora sp. (in: high G+C Gram-positive bacteria)]
MQAYKFALDPSGPQLARLASHCGASRRAFNWGLAWVKAIADQRAAEVSYGLADNELTPNISWSLPSLRKAWNQAKDSIAPWWAENSKEAYSAGLANLATALGNFNASRKGDRAGPKMGFPRFKSKRRARMSCRFTTGVIRLEADRRHVTLPRLGAIRTHESTRKLTRRLEAGTARILSATVNRDSRGRWHVSVQVEIARPERRPACPDSVVAVDLGIKTLAVVAGSSGRSWQIPNPRHLTAALAGLRTASRAVARKQGPDRRTGQVASGRWKKANTRRNKIHSRVSALRRDGLHKLTTRLARTHGTVVVEDLNVAGMVRNRRLARHISDAGFGEFCRQIGYKTGWNGGRLIVADRWFPSSKTCSACQTVKAKLSLAERTYTCEHCGLVIDRDVNAARNLLHHATNGGRWSVP